MAIVGATLGGYDLLALREVGWVFKPGVEPYQRSFLIHRDDLDYLLATRGDFVKLEVTGDTDDDSWFVDRLSVLRAVPTSHPDMAAVLVSDIRWTWRYKWLMRRYNHKRRTGNKKLVNDDGILEFIQFASDDVKYAAYSLRPDTNYTKRWEVVDVVRDVFGFVTDFSYVDQRAIYANQVEVEGLELDDAGPEAIQRVLALLPGAEVRIDEFGTTQIYNSNDGSEFELLDKLGSDVFVGAPLVEQVSMTAERPHKIVVHFSCEDELRFDFVEGNFTRDKDDRYMKNVMPLPITLSINGVQTPKGTWVEITDTLLQSFYAAYPPVTTRGRALPPLTLGALRQIWVNGFFNVYVTSISGPFGDQAWATFMKALREHYRQTFQINPRWMDRLVGITPKRVSLLDEVNNVWGQPSVFANYAIVPSARNVGKTESENTQFAWNRVTFPDPGNMKNVNLADPSTMPAHAGLVIEDAELGIVSVKYVISPNGDDGDVIPSQIEGYDRATGQTADLAACNAAALLLVKSMSRLTDTHALAIVVNALTGSPYDLGQTWPEEVDLEEAKSILPDAVAKLLPDAQGPVMHVHAGPAVQTARFAWSDTHRDKIERAVLYGEPRVFDLMVNNEYVSAVARALAAKIYSTMIDHLEGEPVIAVDPTIHPTGRIGAVEHGVQPDGVTYTKVTLPAPRRGFDFWGLLPEFVRRMIKRQLPR